MKRKDMKKHAFTMVEFLIVLGVVGVLAIALLVGFSGNHSMEQHDARINSEQITIDGGNNQNNNIVNLAHVHKYTEQNTSDIYLVTSATCTKKATYYYSCTCGEQGSNTFEVGSKIDHDYTSQVIDNKYLATPGTCVFGAAYYYSCTMCGQAGSEMFSYGTTDKTNHIGNTFVEYYNKDTWYHTKYILCDACNDEISSEVEEHLFDESGNCTICFQHKHDYCNEVVDSIYLKNAGTCSTAPEYYHSCICGAIGTTSFTYGSSTGHVFVDGEMTAAFLKTPATCASKAEYYRSCMFCGTTGSETFTGGELDPENHIGTTRKLFDKLDDEYHIVLTACGGCSTVFSSVEAEHILDAERTCRDCNTHVHRFNKTIQHANFLKQEATCYSPAEYYYTCMCGECGDETFTVGSTVSHDYKNIETDEFIKKFGTCTTKSVYYKSCRFCGTTSSSTFESTKFNTNAHTGNQIFGGNEDFHLIWDCCGGVASIEHTFVRSLEIPATCTYWGYSRYTCNCGYSFVDQDIPFDYSHHSGIAIYGDGDGVIHTKYNCCGYVISETHTFDQRVENEKYFADVANCISGKTYYKSCKCGYSDHSETFAVGAKNSSNHIGERVYAGTANAHKKCSACNATLENGTKHSFTISTAITATCIKKGTNRYSCECGYSYTSEEIAINPNNHVGTEVFAGTQDAHTKCNACQRAMKTGEAHTFTSSVYIPAKCTEDGTTKFTCECGYYYTKVDIQKIGHAPAKEPVWNNGHLKATVPCTRSGCNAEWSAAPKESTTRNATCVIVRQYTHAVTININGRTESFYCNETHDGQALGHAPNSQPTWDEEHTKVTVSCSRVGCKETWSGVPAEKTTKSATCTIKRIYTHEATFKVNGTTKTFGCGQSHTGVELGHTFGPAATCTSPQLCQRSGCGATLTNPLGHAPSATETWNSTHTRVSVNCTRTGCSKVWTSAPSKKVTTEATCTVKQKYTHTVEMNVNGVVKTFKCNKTHTGAALGHSPSTTPTWKSNCSAVTVKCIRCTKTWTGLAYENTTTAAGCTVKRVYEHKAVFDVNGTSTTYTCNKNHVGSALGHSYGTPSYEWDSAHSTCIASAPCVRSGCTDILSETSFSSRKTIKSATCTATGTYEHEVSFSKSKFETQQCPNVHTAAATGHNITQETANSTYKKSDATCDVAAVYYKNCSNSGCNATGSQTFSSGQPLGHDFTEQKISNTYKKSDATCTLPAYYYYKCSRCSAKGLTVDPYANGNALGHNFTVSTIASKYKKSDADCVNAATYYKNCSRCSISSQGYTNATFPSGNALGHKFTKQDSNAKYLVKAATCLDPAVYQHKCEVCGAAGGNQYDSGKALGHSAGTGPTCTTAQTCTRCSGVIKAKTGHSAGSAATCQAAQTCTKCSAVITAKKDCWSSSLKYHYVSELVMATAALHNKHISCGWCGTELDVKTEHHGATSWHGILPWCDLCNWMIY